LSFVLVYKSRESCTHCAKRKPISRRCQTYYYDRPHVQGTALSEASPCSLPDALQLCMYLQKHLSRIVVESVSNNPHFRSNTLQAFAQIVFQILVDETLR